jgi:hypothetical protein
MKISKRTNNFIENIFEHMVTYGNSHLEANKEDLGESSLIEHIEFHPYQGGSSPVQSLKDMSPEKQQEMLDLYSEPGYSERLRKQKGWNGRS